mmetsp:Transcript_22561/g.27670  ORF Transcript_22561/g.27670 Transcript_22561/m.27670 type:complete len:127 (-) Transcript_22561:215-595(-)
MDGLTVVVGEEDKVGLLDEVGGEDGDIDIVGEKDTVGDVDGLFEGEFVWGAFVEGLEDGLREGCSDGSKESRIDGLSEGCIDGITEGCEDGTSDDTSSNRPILWTLRRCRRRRPLTFIVASLKKIM